uniref:S8 family serine peptidase n=1 Tax=Prevotella sp. TaxID=59823 RepID=UPI004028A60F
TADGCVKPDVTAPGCIIVSAGSRYCSGWSDDTNVIARTGNDLYTNDVGTSMASPYVAGCVALWLQANPNLTPKQVLEVIGNTAVQNDEYMPTGQIFPNNTWGYGRINAIKGLKQLLGTTGIDDVKTTESMYRIITDRQARTATFYIGSDKGQARVAV